MGLKIATFNMHFYSYVTKNNIFYVSINVVLNTFSL